jgi:ABC-type Fe3+-hydroxamate transport system substrate-binding protein
LTEILVTLEGRSELVGVTDACEVDGKAVSRVGPPKAIAIALVGALAPDWIVADSRANRPEEIQTLQKKFRTKVFDVKSVQEVCDTVSDLGRLVERPEEAAKLNQAIHQEAARSEESFRLREKKRTVLLIWNQPYLTVNFDSYPSRLLEASGGVNVFRAEPLVEFPVEMEEMIEKDPELLLLSGEPAPFRKRHLAQFRQYRIFSRIPIHLVNGELLSRYGPQTIDALQTLRQIYESIQ